MVKDHSDSKRGNSLPPLHGLLFSISTNVLLYAPCHRRDGTYYGLSYTSHRAVAGTRVLFFSNNVNVGIINLHLFLIKKTPLYTYLLNVKKRPSNFMSYIEHLRYY